MRKVRFAASTTNIRHAAPSALCRSASTIACIARFAALTGDDELLDQAERLFRKDPIVGHRTQTAWRGNTVLSIDSSNTRSRLSEDQVEGWTPQPEHGLYLTRLQRYRDGAGRDATAAFFMPERTFTW